VQAGSAYGVDVTQSILLNLAQTSDENSDAWHEFILIDEQTTPDQANALLTAFQRQGSEVAHVHRLPTVDRPVYLVPMHYTITEERNILSVVFSPDRSQLIEGDASIPFFQEWSYNGHVAIQQPLEQWNG
jgi:hypothetical protein